LRIEYGLRSEFGEHNYYGDSVIKLCTDILSRAFRNEYPFQSEALYAFVLFDNGKEFESPQEVSQFVDQLVIELEKN
jgi:restriction system protein